MIDYAEEVKKLESGELGDFWTPEPGQYKVKALGELHEIDPYEEEGKEPKTRYALDIEVSGKKKIWTFTKGKTLASTYGQLCQLASFQIGKALTNVDFTVVINNDGKKNTYTIVK